MFHTNLRINPLEASHLHIEDLLKTQKKLERLLLVQRIISTVLFGIICYGILLVNDAETFHKAKVVEIKRTYQLKEDSFLTELKNRDDQILSLEKKLNEYNVARDKILSMVTNNKKNSTPELNAFIADTIFKAGL